MMNINLPLYDSCRKWIVQARDMKKEWSDIRIGLRSTKEELGDFLKTQKSLNFWPNDLDEETWCNLVDSEMEAELKSLSVLSNDRKAVLIDETQDTDVSVPLDERSSWQLYKNHLLNNGFKEESVYEIEHATLGILKRLNNDTTESEAVKGLVIGHVQSGKTANMAALMAMSADWGWNFFVVLSGTIENLRSQTQSRLFRDLNHPGNINWLGLEHLSKKSPLGQKAQNLNFGSNMRYFTVCLKNSARLKNLIEWMQLDPNKMKQMKVIVIDDEADQASVNTADINSKERKRINDLIVNLVAGNTPKGEPYKTIVKSMNYISYTATPYANFLNESAPESLYPKNFIRTLQPSTEYFGPKQIFGIKETEECDGLNIVRTINSYDYLNLQSLHKGEVESIPESMKSAICWFLCGAASMRDIGHKKPISMLIHTSQKQDHHAKVSNAIRDWLKTIDSKALMNMCRKVWKEETSKLTIESFRESFLEYGREDGELNNYQSFENLIEHIKQLHGEITHIPLNEDGELQYHAGIHLCVDNCSNNGITEDGMFVRLAYPDPEKEQPKPASAFIIIGGSTLSRGLTIEGLISTYFLRSTCQADSLMQMGRWFGYRRGYELLPRIWMTKDTLEKYKFLAALEMELRQDLVRYMVAGVSPQEYGPRVKNTPSVSWLRITAKNKMQSAEEIDMDFTGVSPQTIFFDNDAGKLKHNKDITEAFINSLGQGDLSFQKTSYIWRNIEFEDICINLLKKFNFQSRSRVFNQIDDFYKWVSKVSDLEGLDNWNVIVSGSGDHSKRLDARWKFSWGAVNKVNRSRKIGNDDQLINIGVLRSPNDLVADIDPNHLTKESKEKLRKDTKTIDAVEALREEAGLSKTPQLIIYCIDKNSTARENSTNRRNLNAAEDIIGLSIIIPGVKSKENLAKALTIKINRKTDKSEIWGDEE